jgi:outer membrane lipase/esterase
VVFGTSLSDPGNDFALRGIENVPPYDTLDFFLIPDAPYAKGGHHVSNGATWVEQFARSLGLAGSVRPAFQASTLKASNYAVKGARAYDDGVNVNLSAQVGAFVSDFGPVVPSDALYVFEIGANDIRDALAAFAAGGNGGAIIQEALMTVGGSIQELYARGARKFLVWSMPNIRLTPALRLLDVLSPGAGQAAELLTLSYNAGLDAVLGMFAGLPGIEIKRVDAFTLLNEMVANPAAFDLSVVDAACVTPNAPPFECQDPDHYLFWDGIHPTKTAHAIIAQEAAFALGEN